MFVIFDMDGVIFDSERAVIEAYKMLAPKYGLTDIERACLESIGTTRAQTREIFLSYHGRDLDYDTYRGEVHDLLVTKPFDIKPGVFELFDWLGDMGVPAALASSTSTESVYRMLDQAGLTERFTAIICGDTVTRGKPHPEIFLKAAEKLGAEPKDCYVIEDSFNGIRAAHAAGMHPVMVPDILQPDDEIKALAEVVLPSLTEAKEFLSEKYNQ